MTFGPLKKPVITTIEQISNRIEECKRRYQAAKEEYEAEETICLSNPPPASRMIIYAKEIEDLQERLRNKLEETK